MLAQIGSWVLGIGCAIGALMSLLGIGIAGLAALRSVRRAERTLQSARGILNPERVASDLARLRGDAALAPLLFGRLGAVSGHLARITLRFSKVLWALRALVFMPHAT